MADKTNRYAYSFPQRNERNLKPSSQFGNWVKTTMAEMKVFVAMTVALQMVHREMGHTYKFQRSYVRSCYGHDARILLPGLHSVYGPLLQFTTPVYGLIQTWTWHNRKSPCQQERHSTMTQDKLELS